MSSHPKLGLSSWLNRRPNNKRTRRPDDQEEEEYDEDIDAYNEFIPKVAVGRSTSFVRDITETLQHAGENHLDFICVPLFHPRFRRDLHGVSSMRSGTLTRGEMALDSQDWTSNIIGKANSWIDVADSEARNSSAKSLKEEYLFACYLGLQAFVVDLPSVYSKGFSRCIKECIQESPATSPLIWCTTPIHPPSLNGDITRVDGWGVWNDFRIDLEHNTRIHIALELPVDLENFDRNSLPRWSAEPVKAVIISTEAFSLNKRGTRLVLSQNHIRVFHFFFKFNIHVIITGSPRYGLPLRRYARYIENLCKGGEGGNGYPFSLYDKFEYGYRDNLMINLHPLEDNLNSETYMVMEMDPVKYAQYEKAILQALQDKVAAQARLSKEEGHTNRVAIMVVGPGRGPLIQASLNAAKAVHKMQAAIGYTCDQQDSSNNGGKRGQTNAKADMKKKGSAQTVTKIDIYGVEKNMNAVITLRHKFRQSPSVHIILSDVRELRHKLQQQTQARSLVSSQEADKGGSVSLLDQGADIVVSELLGSWGDNELSPECLDTVQKGGLLREDGVMIPQRYTSYIAPMSSSKLWTRARDMAGSGILRQMEGTPSGSFSRDGIAKSGNRSSGLDSPYVVNFHSTCVLTDAKALFEFSHPNLALSRTVDVDSDIEDIANIIDNSGSGSGIGNYSKSKKSNIGKKKNKNKDNCGVLQHKTEHNTNDHNGRESLLSFVLPAEASPTLLHGFAGFFDCCLYGDISFSTVPATHSPGMFSWFPMFLPIAQPVTVSPGVIVEVTIRRCVGRNSVWYEWQLERAGEEGTGGVQKVLQNEGGRSYCVKL